MLHPPQYFTWCTLHISWINRVTIYSLGALLSQFWTSPLFHVWFHVLLVSCIQDSQEAGKVVWYFYLFKNFPQSVVICTVKGFNIVKWSIWLHEANEVKWEFLEFSFSMIQRMLAIWSLVPLPFLNPACISGSSQFMYCWSLVWRILSITLLACGMGAIVW